MKLAKKITVWLLTLVMVVTLVPHISFAKDEKAVKYIHINGYYGDDNNDGLTENTSVKTFEKAKTLIDDGDIILIDSLVEITKDETWDLSDKPNSKVQRNSQLAMIEVKGTATLTLKNIVIDGKHYTDPQPNSNEIICLGETSGNKDKGANLVLKSGAVLENNQNNKSVGGAVGGYSYNTIIMEDGAAIRNNGTLDQTAEFGGGIHLENHGTFIMNGGVIENNHAVRGGGVCLIASSMEMNGGVIRNNSANSKETYAGHYGGGIYIANFQDWSNAGLDNSREIAGEANFTMNGGTITGNEATYQNKDIGDYGMGGAIATYPAFYAGHESDPKVNINIYGGNITNNKGVKGGALSTYFDATDVNISNANISNNEAINQGGAIYGVFNSEINLKDTVISQNKASVGAGVYLHSSEMNMTSGQISNNTAEKYGGGILIDKPAWNNKTAVCNILGGTIKDNKATLGKGSDGIYQNSKLNIGEKAIIDKENDIYLPSGKIVDVIKPLENITQDNYVTITSEDCVVEDDQNSGTPLIKYHEAAGAIDAAKKAELDQLYIASKYMQEGLVIGKSQAANQLDIMTYVQKEKYPVKYTFVSTNSNETLPSEVTSLIPTDNRKYIEGATVKGILPSKTQVTVDDGLWAFNGYDAESKLSSVDNLNDQGFIEFTGTWEFKRNAAIINQAPTIDAHDKTIYVGDEFNPLKDVTATDKEDGDITLTIENVIKNEVDNTKVGVYEVTYKVTDSQGASTTKTIKVTVIAKDTPSDSDDPNTPQNPNTPDEQDKPDKQDKPENKSPETGDDTNMGLLAVLLLVSAAGALKVCGKKRKTN